MESDATTEAEEVPVKLESQLILRLPPDMAVHLRELLKSPITDLHKRFFMKAVSQDMRHFVVKLDKWTIPGKLYDIPCLTECFKTLDRKVFYKIADIGQMIICGNKEALDINEKPYLCHEFLDKHGRDKRYLYPHGLTPCLKNVRKKRFRKTLRNKCAEIPSVEKEVLRLLVADSEAVHHRFELVEEEPKSSDEKKPKDSDIGQSTRSIRKFDIFGAISSSSEESDEEDDQNPSCLQRLENPDVQNRNGEGRIPCKGGVKDERSACPSSNPQPTFESEAVSTNLVEIKEQTDDEKKLTI